MTITMKGTHMGRNKSRSLNMCRGRKNEWNVGEEEKNLTAVRNVTRKKTSSLVLRNHTKHLVTDAGGDGVKSIMFPVVEVSKKDAYCSTHVLGMLLHRGHRLTNRRRGTTPTSDAPTPLRICFQMSQRETTTTWKFFNQTHRPVDRSIRRTGEREIRSGSKSATKPQPELRT